MRKARHLAPWRRERVEGLEWPQARRAISHCVSRVVDREQ